jgi:hypothetical protein
MKTKLTNEQAKTRKGMLKYARDALEAHGIEGLDEQTIDNAIRNSYAAQRYHQQFDALEFYREIVAYGRTHAPTHAGT